MSATPYDVAMAWLTVARSALENAARVANELTEYELDHYTALRADVEESIRLAQMAYRQKQLLAEVFHDHR